MRRAWVILRTTIKYGIQIRLRPEWGVLEESLANVEIVRTANSFIGKVQSELGGVREYRGLTFEEVLEQVIIDLQEEFEVPDLTA